MQNEDRGVQRKFEWVDKWAKMTGDRARIDARANNTYIVYKKNDQLVKEYPNGEIVPFTDSDRKKDKEDT
ncbi:hypothetical protein DH09_00665 (plasmid) [Bacillaceae bacterium JMAK1]|nr:hypothetical protein DH09_00665 [Bacillaceae bacterium JMAK1]